MDTDHKQRPTEGLIVGASEESAFHSIHIASLPVSNGLVESHRLWQPSVCPENVIHVGYTASVLPEERQMCQSQV